MNHFTIRDIENLSGIKAHTLRIWEQRYQLSCCQRKESNHRFYTNDDLKYILRIAYLYHNGFRISKLAGMEATQIKELAATHYTGAHHNLFIQQLVEACIDYDTVSFEAVLNKTVTSMGFEKAVTEIIYPFMQKMGMLWLTNHVLPAQEHFSSALIRKRFLTSINALESQNLHPTIRPLLFAPAGEAHELPLLFIQYLLKRNGYHPVVMGVNIKEETLDYYCAHQQVSHLWLHVITNFTGETTHNYLQRLAETYTDKKIIATGPAISINRHLPGNILILKSLEETIAVCKKLNSLTN